MGPNLRIYISPGLDSKDGEAVYLVYYYIQKVES